MNLNTSIIKNVLKENLYFECRRAFIRGSFARGENTIKSDMDLLIVSNDFNGMAIKKRKEIVKKVFDSSMDNIIDCICLTEAEYNQIIAQKRNLLLKEVLIEVII
ncbi:nucleotidyltransferase domain-containing protein [Weizmannia coagulans]|uniref:Nucleotidyltransferase domain-containing protein n=1 Tax=Heyndrickxia faecalis TaxID=2824910 RepID=A0ABV3NJF9_9BACI|nr:MULTISPECIES: nucleotidyltransferase domain-containing protein [Heyndrickxia]MBT2196199.1 nucleotidyltransferase domain-containing protein [Heyndrickxia coagulans]MBT2238481.1 nucleotidyltransferase domain-containing protein [Heyndrickxia coagulans]MCR4445321.1 nucleotidyltransferase domain-containing protein [Heyndrickxia coagulans]MCU6438391.1 hypothetical protein [Heyndrickxia coagulans]MCW8781791.1 nucleotidyltransferase domain-containing protein [Heyndrickxia coagulans]